ncbi:ABC transporter substrate-binding protein [Sporomusa sp. KB1]|jgi:iron complex transport system substrate-binding protein|uniref:ABC transporter substrate-binding protein n=1 Tax=Sporomusa sp. KB1 TaxID=943346 RepID=UPI0011A761EE|nr:ABC transporter substrate-binding protein [Sporomusa sp. KB1]TWH48120.1 iron complex transport system substrate-binding protein [Sporomusa sp. KB1]
MLKLGVACLVMVLLLMLIAGCNNSQPVAQSKQSQLEITDMVGRKVTIPREVNKIYAPIYGTVILNAIVPDKLVKLTNSPGDQGDKQPGGMSKKIKEAAPDIIVANTQIDADNAAVIAAADKMQNELGIPVVVIENRLAELDKTYDFIGELLQEQEKAKVLADYCRATFAEIKTALDKIPQEKRVHVYYAEGPDGLATDPAQTRHSQVLDLAGGINVAQVASRTGPGQTPVSIEQVREWNPDVIIANRMKKDDPESFRDYVLGNPEWENIKAVNERRVYDIPKQLNNWFDRPPSANRVIGLKWLANLLYPDYVKIDMKSETKKFYKLFYHYDLTDQEVENLLGNTAE